MKNCGLRIADCGLPKGRLLVGGVFLLLAVVLLAPMPAQDKGKSVAKDKDEPPPVSPRVVGTVIFPPRSDLQRISSAD